MKDNILFGFGKIKISLEKVLGFVILYSLVLGVVYFDYYGRLKVGF